MAYEFEVPKSACNTHGRNYKFTTLGKASIFIDNAQGLLNYQIVTVVRRPQASQAHYQSFLQHP